jgi:lipopolysaccharide export LptBFGC system permease protein LptF
LITWERADDTRAAEVTATKAEYLDGSWWLHNMQVQKFTEKDQPIGGKEPANPQNTITELRDLDEKPSDFENEVKDWRYFSVREMLGYLKTHRTLSEQTVKEKTYDLHARLAMPWACLIVTLFAVPVGARTGRQSILTAIFMALACFMAFYAMMNIGILLGKKGFLWPWLAAWLSNIAFLVAGLRMMRKLC